MVVTCVTLPETPMLQLDGIKDRALIGEVIPMLQLDEIKDRTLIGEVIRIVHGAEPDIFMWISPDEYTNACTKYEDSKDTYFRVELNSSGSPFLYSGTDKVVNKILYNYVMYREKVDGPNKLIIGKRHNDLEIGVKHVNLATYVEAEYVLFGGEIKVEYSTEQNQNSVHYNFESGTYSAQLLNDLKKREKAQMMTKWNKIMASFVHKWGKHIRYCSKEGNCGPYGGKPTKQSIEQLRLESIGFYLFGYEPTVKRYAFLFAYGMILQCAFAEYFRLQRQASDARAHDPPPKVWLEKQIELVKAKQQTVLNERWMVGESYKQWIENESYWLLEGFELSWYDEESVIITLSTFVKTQGVGIDEYIGVDSDGSSYKVTVGGLPLAKGHLSEIFDRIVDVCMTKKIGNFSPFYKPWEEFYGRRARLFSYRITKIKSHDMNSDFPTVTPSDNGVGLTIRSLHNLI
jgi:hypothetical protein